MNGLMKLTWNEMKLFLREPFVVFFAVLFPTLLVVILGSIPSFREPSKDLGGLRVVDLYVPISIALSLALLGLTARCLRIWVPTARRASCGGWR